MDIDLELDEITPEQLYALAQFVKRVGWREMRDNAVSDREADLMGEAISKLQRSLAKAGYAPR